MTVRPQAARIARPTTIHAIGAALARGAAFDSADCSCTRVLWRPYGYATDGSNASADYAPDSDVCWLLKPNGTHAGKQVALTFGRFDIDRFDRIDIYDGNMVSSTRLSPVLGLWGLGSPVLGSPTSAHVNLHDLARNSSNGALLIEFHSDFEYAAAGFLFGWTVLPLPSDSAHFCATDCAVDERSRRAGMGLRGDGVCDAAHA